VVEHGRLVTVDEDEVAATAGAANRRLLNLAGVK
jgi:hypothetical protein